MTTREPRDDRRAHSLSLTTGGITLIGVLISVGVTVSFGLMADWPIRVAAGVATTVILAAVVKLGTQSGKGPIARFANWMIGVGDERP